MKVCMVPVCYNAYDDALRFLESVDRAFLSCSDLSLEVVLADNSTVVPPADKLDRQYRFKYTYQKNGNVGYFPAFNSALSVLSESVEGYNFVIVCNVDLVVADDFFLVLAAQKVRESVGLIAPGIFSDKDGRDLNPKIMQRPKAAKINFMRLVCSSSLLFRGYSKLAQLREVRRSRFQQRQLDSGHSSQPPVAAKMYGAHGSFMIFTKVYFMRGADVNYPRFLFGEEVFVAEQLRTRHLEIDHLPVLRIFDKEHASTSKVKFGFICGEHKKSYDYLYERFFKVGL